MSGLGRRSVSTPPRWRGMLPPVEFTVIGAGRSAARSARTCVRAGHDVLFCDADAAHVAAINARGLRIEGPVEEFTVPARAVLPAGPARPRSTGPCVAVKSPPHRGRRRACCADRLAPDAYVAVAAERADGRRHRRGRRAPTGCCVGFVNFGADYLEPGVVLQGNVAHLPGRRAVGPVTDRVPRAGRRPALRRGHRQHRRLPVGEGGLRRDALRDRRLRPVASPTRWTTPRYRPLMLGPRARGARPGPGASRGRSTASTPTTCDGLARPARRLQPGQRQVAQRHLPRPGGAQAQDRGRRPARRRSPARSRLRRRAGQGDRARRAAPARWPTWTCSPPTSGSSGSGGRCTRWSGALPAPVARVRQGRCTGSPSRSRT